MKVSAGLRLIHTSQVNTQRCFLVEGVKGWWIAVITFLKQVTNETFARTAWVPIVSDFTRFRAVLEPRTLFFRKTFPQVVFMIYSAQHHQHIALMAAWLNRDAVSGKTDGAEPTRKTQTWDHCGTIMRNCYIRKCRCPRYWAMKISFGGTLEHYRSSSPVTSFILFSKLVCSTFGQIIHTIQVLVRIEQDPKPVSGTVSVRRRHALDASYFHTYSLSEETLFEQIIQGGCNWWRRHQLGGECVIGDRLHR